MQVDIFHHTKSEINYFTVVCYKRSLRLLMLKHFQMQECIDTFLGILHNEIGYGREVTLLNISSIHPSYSPCTWAMSGCICRSVYTTLPFSEVFTLFRYGMFSLKNVWLIVLYIVLICLYIYICFFCF